MIKIYFASICLLLNLTLFATRYITISDPPKIVNPLFLVNPQTPLPLSRPSLRLYQNFLPMERSLVKYIDPLFLDHNQTTLNIYYPKGKSLQSLFDITLPSKSCYRFAWGKEHPSSKLNDLKKQIASYYLPINNPNPKTQFLYSYGKPTMKGKHKSEPWAIKIGEETHATIWVKAELRDNSDNSSDSFLQFNEEGNPNIEVLVDENDTIIAKRINQEKPIFREK